MCGLFRILFYYCAKPKCIMVYQFCEYLKFKCQTGCVLLLKLQISHTSYCSGRTASKLEASVTWLSNNIITMLKL